MTRVIVVKRYSIAFKQQIVKEYENGMSIARLKQKYGITGNTTIQKWIKKHGREGLRHQVMIIQSPDDQNEQKKMEAKMKLLEEVIINLTVENTILKSALAVEESSELKESSKKKGPQS